MRLLLWLLGWWDRNPNLNRRDDWAPICIRCGQLFNEGHQHGIR